MVTLFVTKNNIKNRSQSVPPAAKNGSQWGSASNNNIPQNGNVVNSQDMQKNEKHSLDWIDFAEEKEKERSLASEITELKKMVEELRGKIQHPGVKHIVSKLAVQKVARSLKSGYMSKINLQVLTDELFTFYGYMANENGLSYIYFAWRVPLLF